LEGKPEYQSETLEGVAADRFIRDQRRKAGLLGTSGGEPLTEQRIHELAEEAERGYDVKDLKQQMGRKPDVTPPSGLIGLFTGQRTEDPRVVRRAKARDAFYRRATAILLVAMICATVLGVTWMLTR